MGRKRNDRDSRALTTAALFREVNERIETVSAGFQATEAEFFCECGDGRCTERLRLTLAEYEGVRRDAARFVTALGHEQALLGRIVDVTERFSVVEAETPDAIGIPFRRAGTCARRPLATGVVPAAVRGGAAA